MPCEDGDTQGRKPSVRNIKFGVVEVEGREFHVWIKGLGCANRCSSSGIERVDGIDDMSTTFDGCDEGRGKEGGNDEEIGKSLKFASSPFVLNCSR